MSRFTSALVCIGVLAGAQGAGPVGTWRGTSLCTDRTVAPACRDEAVVFDVSAVPGTGDTVSVRGDKVVNGVREWMYTFPFVRGADGAWTAEVAAPRFHGRWSLVVRGDSMTGTLTDLPTGATVRRVALAREPTGPPGH